MVKFIFRVNGSFLRYPSHPITIPRSRVDYARVEEILGNKEEVWIGIVGTATARGIIYSGRSGWGEYLQIQAREPMYLGRDWLQLGKLVEVLIFEADRRVEIHVRPWSGGGDRIAA
jgi:hypothetical protein